MRKVEAADRCHHQV